MFPRIWRPLRRARALSLLVFWMAASGVPSLSLLGPPIVAAQSNPAKGQNTAFVLALDVATVILSEPGADTRLVIGISPMAALPPNSFMRVKGLPESVQLTDGHQIAAGAWAIPIDGLATLGIKVPPGMQGKSELSFTLFSIEGRILAEARSALVIAPAGLIAPSAAEGRVPLVVPAPKPATRSTNQISLPRATDEKPGSQAQRLLDRGNDQLRAGSMVAARALLERAADLGSAEAALALASTYDALELSRFGALGVQPNPELARRWYARAQDLGATVAAERLARLPK
jgi:hypothetical protein